MNSKIIPSIIAKNQRELDFRLNKTKKISKKFHLDIMDANFVKNKSLLFDFKIPKKMKYEAHLMIKNPKEWIEKNYKKVNLIIFHFESLKKNEIKNLIKFVKSKKRKVGISIKPRTKVNEIKNYLKGLDVILLMTVNPGSYGAKFLPYTLKKISEIKKVNSKIKVQVDGGINDKTILIARDFEIDSFVSGSYLQKAKDIKKAVSLLDKSIKRR